MTSYQKLKKRIEWLEDICDRYACSINNAKNKVCENPSVIFASTMSIGSILRTQKLEKDPYKLVEIICSIPIRHQLFCNRKNND